MKKTEVHWNSDLRLTYHDKAIFLGSCFSDNLSQKMHENGFSVTTNPLGVVFNPISIADFILYSEEDLKNTVFLREDVALSWLANSTFFAYEKQVLQEKIVASQQAFLEEIKQTSVLFVTFGTAWTYFHLENQAIVANCHKQAGDKFSKSLLSVDEIVVKWQKAIEKLRKINPSLKIVFTLSPVRHSKDGLVENNLSKAILLQAIHSLCELSTENEYFPAYEIVLDELRDYAFYTSDGVHPNEHAIHVIWERFKELYFTEETIEINKEQQKLQGMFRHRSLHSESEATKQLELKRVEELERFRKRYPFVELLLPLPRDSISW